MDGPAPSLIEWAGGEPAIRRMIHAFYDRVGADDLLSPFYEAMLAHHRDLAITAEQANPVADPPGR